MPKTSITPEPPEPAWLTQLRHTSFADIVNGYDYLDQLRDKEELEADRNKANAYRKGAKRVK